MLWVLKRAVSMRRFFWAPKTHVKTDGYENIFNFMLKNCVMTCLLISLVYLLTPLAELVYKFSAKSKWVWPGNTIANFSYTTDQDRGAAGLSLTSITALCAWARHINPSLVQVQPRKTRPFITERLLMGRKKSNQTNLYSINTDKNENTYHIRSMKYRQYW